MSKYRANIILGVLSTLVIIATIILYPKSPQTSITSAKIYPELLAKLNTVITIRVKSQDETIHIKKSQDKWYVDELASFPADFYKVKDFLFSIAELIKYQQKTKNPKYYSQLQVEDIDNDDAQSILVSLFDKSGNKIVNLLIGKDRPAKIQKQMQEIYVRKTSEATTWLALGSIPAFNSPTDWIEPAIIDLNLNRIQKVTIGKSKSNKVVITKTKKADDKFKIVQKPKKKKLKKGFDPNSLALTLSRLAIDSVIDANDFKLGKKNLTSIYLKTNDGIAIDYIFKHLKDKVYVKLKAKSIKTANKKDEQQAKEIAKLNERFDKWVFVVPEYQSAALKTF